MLSCVVLCCVLLYRVVLNCTIYCLGGGGTPVYNWRRSSSKFSKATPKSYHIGCGSSQFHSLKVTSEIFIHRNSTGILKIIAKRQQVLLQMNEYWHVRSRKRSKNYNFDSKYKCFLPGTLKVAGSTISTPKSYDEHPRQVKYVSCPPPPPPGYIV